MEGTPERGETRLYLVSRCASSAGPQLIATTSQAVERTDCTDFQRFVTLFYFEPRQYVPCGFINTVVG